MAATIQQCVILAGDSGDTQMAPALREFQRFGVTDFLLLTHHPISAPDLPKPARINQSPLQDGAASSLLGVQHRLHEKFLLCDSYAVPNFNIARLLADAANDPAPARIAHHNGSPAGVAVCRRNVLPYLHPATSTQELLSALQAAGALHGTEVAHLPTLPAARPALFLDRDGTINIDHGWVGARDRFQWIDGAIEAIRTATEAGWHVFVVTNQSGIARGYYDEAALASLHDWMVDTVRAARGTIDDLRFCPFHPDATVERYRRVSDWRKPAPGMILDLIARWQLDPARCVLVGDQPTDLAAAQAAGIPATHFPGGNLAHTIRPLLAAMPASQSL